MFYWFVIFSLRIFFTFFCRIKYFNRNLAPRGGFIVASNHVSYYDPLSVGAGLPRKVRYMAKKELFEDKYLGGIMPYLATFPVDREIADRKAIKRALEILKSDGVVGIFPEGRRSEGGAMEDPKQGAAMLSIMSGKPIFPAAIVGTKDILVRKFPPKFKQVFVKYGEPIYPDRFEGDKKEKMAKITDAMNNKIIELKKELEQQWAP